MSRSHGGSPSRRPNKLVLGMVLLKVANSTNAAAIVKMVKAIVLCLVEIIRIVLERNGIINQR